MHPRFVMFAALVALSASAVGCSGAADIEALDAEETSVIGDAESALTTREHFAPQSAELVWRPGCGMRRPDGTACYIGLQLVFAKTSRDLKVSIRTSVNNSTDTITVKLDTWSTNSHHAHAPVMTESKTLGFPKRLSTNKTYRARVLDFEGQEVWTGEIRAAFAP